LKNSKRGENDFGLFFDRIGKIIEEDKKIKILFYEVRKNFQIVRLLSPLSCLLEFIFVFNPII